MTLNPAQERGKSSEHFLIILMEHIYTHWYLRT